MRGKGARPLLEFEIKNAQKSARSAAEAARILGVSYNTYVKYAKMYGIHESFKNPHGIGIPKSGHARGKYPLKDILDGKYPNYEPHRLKSRLIRSGYLEEKCSCCGFDEKRITDDRVPIQINFKDGNSRNHTYDNLELLCYNCYFLQVGNLIGNNKHFMY